MTWFNYAGVLAGALMVATLAAIIAGEGMRITCFLLVLLLAALITLVITVAVTVNFFAAWVLGMVAMVVFAWGCLEFMRRGGG